MTFLLLPFFSEVVDLAWFKSFFLLTEPEVRGQLSMQGVHLKSYFIIQLLFFIVQIYIGNLLDCV